MVEVELSANDSTHSTSNGASKSLDLPTDLNKKALKEIIEHELGITDDNYTVEYSPASSKGDNYLGVLYRVQIKRNGKSEMSLVVKLPPESEARREQFFIVPVFTRESMFYEKVYPMMKKFQEEKGINVDEEGFNAVPKCYKSMTELRSEAIFLEDLKVKGFEMFDRFKIVDIAHVSKIMETLGKLHAVSFALKDQRMDLLKPYTEIVDIFMMRDADKNVEMWLESVKQRGLDVIKDHENKEMVKKANEALTDTCFKEMGKMVNSQAAEPYTILTHGDCWNNNVMFKYENGVPKEVCLVDWQLMRYASPILDVVYYIFCCTTKEFREVHYQESLDIYYNSLQSYLKRLGSDPEKVFPRSAFEMHLKKFGKFGLIMSTMVLPMFTTAAEDIPDLDELSEKLSSGQEVDVNEFNAEATMDIYKKRMADVFEDMFNLGYI